MTLKINGANKINKLIVISNKEMIIEVSIPLITTLTIANKNDTRQMI